MEIQNEVVSIIKQNTNLIDLTRLDDSSFETNLTNYSNNGNNQSVKKSKQEIIE